jgi:hypothetical protein
MNSTNPTNLLERLLNPSGIRFAEHDYSEMETGYTSFISSGLPLACNPLNPKSKTEVNVHLIQDQNPALPLKIQVVSLQPLPYSAACRIALATELTQLPIGTHSAASNLNTVERGGQLLLEFSVQRPLAPWIQKLIPPHLGGVARSPLLIQSATWGAFSALLFFMGLALLFPPLFKKRSFLR